MSRVFYIKQAENGGWILRVYPDHKDLQGQLGSGVQTQADAKDYIFHEFGHLQEKLKSIFVPTQPVIVPLGSGILKIT